MAVSEEKKEMQDPRTQAIASTIRVVPNFPKPGSLSSLACCFLA